MVIRKHPLGILGPRFVISLEMFEETLSENKNPFVRKTRLWELFYKERLGNKKLKCLFLFNFFFVREETLKLSLSPEKEKSA